MLPPMVPDGIATQCTDFYTDKSSQSFCISEPFLKATAHLSATHYPAFSGKGWSQASNALVK